MLIDLVVYDGVDEMDVVGPLEVFRSAATAGAEVTARLVTRVPQPIVTGAFGLGFEPDAVYQAGADVLLVPGGGWLARSDPGAWGEYRRGAWPALLRGAHEAGAGILAGVCTGTMLLAHAGVIGPRPATTHHGAWPDLEATGVQLVRERVVDDGDLVTCGGVSSGIDLALWLLEREVSFALAELVAERMEYSRVRPWKSERGVGHG
jgi:transcriptional regulator GlxA family with amidase domain